MRVRSYGGNGFGVFLYNVATENRERRLDYLTPSMGIMNARRGILFPGNLSILYLMPLHSGALEFNVLSNLMLPMQKRGVMPKCMYQSDPASILISDFLSRDWGGLSFDASVAGRTAQKLLA